MGQEQSAAFYDRTYWRHLHWHRHYTRSPYYPMWSIVADRIHHAGVKSILDIGCGPGQVAALLRDSGIQQYVGVDFSAARVKRARKVCPEFEFQIADAFESDLLGSGDYDAIVCLEFLEHVERDTQLLGMLRPGVRFWGSVPSFGGEAHVRYFTDRAEVEERYRDSIDDLSVDVHLPSRQGKTYFVLEGTVAR